MMIPGQIDEVTKDDAEGVRQNREGGGESTEGGLEKGAIWEMVRKKWTRINLVTTRASQQRIDKLSLFDNKRRGGVKEHILRAI